MGRVNGRVPVHVEIPVPEVVGEDDDKVGSAI
jgi:hypothetical protein